MQTPPSDRTRIRRLPERGDYDRETIHAILDEALICHVATVRHDHPAIVPTLFARRDDALILHGSPASATLRTAASGHEICVGVTLVDGLVLARSAFHHSANYRSVVIYGTARKLTEPGEKRAALDHLTDRMVPGRRPTLRPMTDQEAKSTLVLELPISEASAKVRTGWPGDEPEDYDLPIWAGVVPVTQTYGDPLPDPRNHEDATEPEHLGFFRS